MSSIDFILGLHHYQYDFEAEVDFEVYVTMASVGNMGPSNW